VNRADVSVTLRDVYGQTITDEVEITFYNQKVHSLSQRFPVKFKGQPVTLPGVPAFPTGLAEVFIKPKKYRYKSIFINVVTGSPNAINEDMFLDPDRARLRCLTSMTSPRNFTAQTFGASSRSRRSIRRCGTDLIRRTAPPS